MKKKKKRYLPKLDDGIDNIRKARGAAIEFQRPSKFQRYF